MGSMVTLEGERDLEDLREGMNKLIGKDVTGNQCLCVKRHTTCLRICCLGVDGIALGCFSSYMWQSKSWLRSWLRDIGCLPCSAMDMPFSNSLTPLIAERHAAFCSLFTVPELVGLEINS